MLTGPPKFHGTRDNLRTMALDQSALTDLQRFRVFETMGLWFGQSTANG